MLHDAPRTITRLLHKWKGPAGVTAEPTAEDDLFKAIKPELLRIAARYIYRFNLRGWVAEDVLGELYLKLAPWRPSPLPDNRHQFFALVSKIVKNLLRDAKRRARREKRPNSQLAVCFEDAARALKHSDSKIKAFEFGCLLAKISARQQRVFELRYLRGLSVAQTAEALGISPITVKREYKRACLNIRTLLGYGS